MGILPSVREPRRPARADVEKAGVVEEGDIADFKAVRYEPCDV